MSRRWTGKALIDELAARLWDTSTDFREKIIGWINEIQDDIASEIPLDYYKFQMKKVLPTDQSIVSLNPEKPSATSASLASGGSLTDGSTYKCCVTYVYYDDDGENYVESEQSDYSSELTADASNKTIDVTLPTLTEDTTVTPTDIRRRVYLATKASGESSFSEPFFVSEIADNTTTSTSITAETTSTITPPSDSELDQISETHMQFPSSSKNKYLTKRNQNDLIRFGGTDSTTTSPDSFDFVGTDRIFLFPKLSSSATTAQRTLKYYIYRRPKEVFYDVDREIDMPITLKKALVQGVIWKAYEYSDRAGFDTQLNNYEQYKRRALQKLTRQKGRPTSVRDVEGDCNGFEVN